MASGDRTCHPVKGKNDSALRSERRLLGLRSRGPRDVRFGSSQQQEDVGGGSGTARADPVGSARCSPLAGS